MKIILKICSVEPFIAREKLQLFSFKILSQDDSRPVIFNERSVIRPESFFEKSAVEAQKKSTAENPNSCGLKITL